MLPQILGTNLAAVVKTNRDTLQFIHFTLFLHTGVQEKLAIDIGTQADEMNTKSLAAIGIGTQTDEWTLKFKQVLCKLLSV